MRILLIYKTLSGFTEEYAKWISEDLSIKCLDLKMFKREMVDKNTIIIFGGSLHAIGINGFKEFKNKIGSNYKEIIVFAVGASPKRNGIENELKVANFETEEVTKMRLFYLRGGFDYSKLGLKNKILMSLLRFKILCKKESARTGDEKGILASYKKPLDATKRENIKEIVEYVKSLIEN